MLPIAKVLLRPEHTPTPEGSPYAGEIVLLKAELRVQAERVESLRDRNAILENRVDFMQHQIEIKDRRLDEREEIIRKVMAERDELRKRVEAMDGVAMLR